MQEPYDASDKGQVKARIRASQRADDRKARVLMNLMNTRDGREWMKDLLASCGVARNPFATDPVVMGFNCGTMNVGLVLTADLVKHAPQQYMLMLNEEPEMNDDRSSSGNASTDPGIARAEPDADTDSSAGD